MRSMTRYGGRIAYRLVRANKGSPGVDGMTFEDIDATIGIDTFLLELAQDLKNKTYKPSPVRRVMNRPGFDGGCFVQANSGSGAVFCIR